VSKEKPRLAVGTTKSLLASTPVIPINPRHSRAGGNPEECRVCWPCAEHPRKQVRKWKRACQLRLIEERNPDLISGFPPARE
jgi:hypothetical protein